MNSINCCVWPFWNFRLDDLELLLGYLDACALPGRMQSFIHTSGRGEPDDLN